MQIIETPGEVFDLVQMDFTGPLPTSIHGNRYVISLTDYLSKYVISKAVANDSAATAAEFLVETSLEFGPPQQIQTDRGTHFTAQVFEGVSKKLGCKHTISTPYHPQSQGVVERFNSTFKQQLSKYINEHHDDWDEYLKIVITAYNSSIHQTTLFTPFQVFHKRKPISVFDPVKRKIMMSNVNDYWNHFVRSERFYLDQIQHIIRREQERMKRRYDRNRPDISFRIGENVFIARPGIRPTFSQLYEGPFTISKQLGPQTFDVVDTEGRTKRTHSSQMKPFVERD
jgi:transposase InsO family protein